MWKSVCSFQVRHIYLQVGSRNHPGNLVKPDSTTLVCSYSNEVNAKEHARRRIMPLTFQKHQQNKIKKKRCLCQTLGSVLILSKAVYLFLKRNTAEVQVWLIMCCRSSLYFTSHIKFVSKMMVFARVSQIVVILLASKFLQVPGNTANSCYLTLKLPWLNFSPLWLSQDWK